jgi:hypothetical protein
MYNPDIKPGYLKKDWFKSWFDLKNSVSLKTAGGRNSE